MFLSLPALRSYAIQHRQPHRLKALEFLLHFRGPSPISCLLKIGEPIPDAVLRRLDAELVSVAELLDASWSNEVIFLFISFNCAPCRSIIDDLDIDSQEGLKSQVHLVVQESKSYDDVEEVQFDNLSPWLRNSLIIDGSASGSVPLSATLGVAGLPCAVLVSSSDRTVQAAATGKEEIAKLLDL